MPGYSPSAPDSAPGPELRSRSQTAKFALRSTAQRIQALDQDIHRPGPRARAARRGRRTTHDPAGTGALTRELVGTRAAVVAAEPSAVFVRALRVGFAQIEVHEAP